MKKSVVIGAIWGLLSIFGAISGMIHISGMQRSVTGSWNLDAIFFFPAFLSWQLTKIFPETIVMGIIVLLSPIFIGALIGYMIGRFYEGLIK